LFEGKSVVRIERELPEQRRMTGMQSDDEQVHRCSVGLKPEPSPDNPRTHRQAHASIEQERVAAALLSAR
jgi:hypothetical protein